MVNVEFGKMWKEAVVAHFEVALCKHCPEILKTTTKILIIVGAEAEIRTGNLLNTNLGCYCFAILFGVRSYCPNILLRVP